ncbi:MAG: hypothetical protein KatS3mg081_2383 [Gemmatimonadales bacterium]|nr:MAG: hypothetical protein KatS3mg081_2383 [Gemmatimonadales bacterium]
MTLIVGILCQNGVVLAADGAATLSAMGQHTVRQPIKKLEVISNSIILGVSGPVGLAQRFGGILRDMWDARELANLKAYEAMQLLRRKFFEYVECEMRVAQVSKPLIGPNAATAPAISSTVVALPIRGEPCLFQFDHQCSPEQVTPGLPFVAIGSGQLIADPFLAFIKRIFWSEGPPSLSDGLFAAVWTLRHAIDTNPGGVSDPIQAVVLKKEGKNWIAEDLTSHHLEEHEEAIKAAEDHLRKFKSSLLPDETGAGSPRIPGQGSSD